MPAHSFRGCPGPTLPSCFYYLLTLASCCRKISHDTGEAFLSPCLCALRHPEPSGPCSSERPRPASPGGRECSLQSLQPLFWAQRTHHHKHTLCWCPETPAGVCQTPLHLKWSPSPLPVCPSLLSLEIKSIGKSLKTKSSMKII